MSLAGTLGHLLETDLAYIVRYISKNSTLLGIVGIVYTNRHEIKNGIQKFATKHVLDKKVPNAIEDNLFECLQYID